MKSILPIYQSFRQSRGLITDTRANVRDKVYLALKGERFDGNTFAQQALGAGATAVVVSHDAEVDGTERVFRVEDTLQTLQALAHYHRHQLDKPVIGITGSNGKTTTKELVHAVLSKRYNVHATAGNLNNQIGVPLTILGATEDHDLLLVEMGTNEPGEIERLAQIAQPDYGLITNIGKAHIEKLLSLEGVLHEKTALFREVRGRGGICFVPTHDHRLMAYSEDWEDRFTFGLDEAPSLTSQATTIKVVREVPNIGYEQHGSASTTDTQIYGLHNAYNIAAAVAIGQYFGVPTSAIDAAIADYRADNNRSEVHHLGGVTIFCDAYNANPISMSAAIDSLLQWPAKRKVAILGDMLELGVTAEQEHLQMVERTKTHSDLEAYFVGPAFKKATDTAFIDADELIISGLLDDFIKEQHTAILIKGSRSMRLERLYPYLGIHVE